MGKRQWGGKAGVAERERRVTVWTQGDGVQKSGGASGLRQTGKVIPLLWRWRKGGPGERNVGNFEEGEAKRLRVLCYSLWLHL